MDNTKVKDLAGRLIACPGTEFTEAHRASLEALPENVLESLMPVKAPANADDATATTTAVTTTAATTTAAGKPAAVAAPVAAGAAPEAATVASADAPETVSISKADFDSWQGIVAEHNVRRAAEREKLTSALLAHPNAKPAGVTAESLAAKPIEELRSFATLLDIGAPADPQSGVVDFRFAAAYETVDVAPEPKPYTRALEAARAATKAPN